LYNEREAVGKDDGDASGKATDKQPDAKPRTPTRERTAKEI